MTITGAIFLWEGRRSFGGKKRFTVHSLRTDKKLTAAVSSSLATAVVLKHEIYLVSAFLLTDDQWVRYNLYSLGKVELYLIILLFKNYLYPSLFDIRLGPVTRSGQWYRSKSGTCHFKKKALRNSLWCIIFLFFLSHEISHVPKQRLLTVGVLEWTWHGVVPQWTHDVHIMKKKKKEPLL